MRRTALFWLTALMLLTWPAASDAFTRSPLIPVKVKPARGGRHTRIAVSLRTVDPIGRNGILDRTDTLSVAGPAHRGCRASRSMTLPDASGGSEVRVTLVPGRDGWCTGRFKGAIVESERVACGDAGPPHACPDFAVAPETIARFGFTVTL